MRIGVISDLHLNFRKSSDAVFSAIIKDISKVDVIVNAGDIHPNEKVRNLIQSYFEDLGVGYIEVLGNHDYEKTNFRNDYKEINYYNVRFRCATLWTNFDENPNCELEANRWISDFKEIKGASIFSMKSAYYEAKEFLFREPCDVIVTHFGCHPLSVHSKYKNDILNGYFINNLDKEIETKGPELWIHGHTHQTFDYKIHNTRVVCNPLGYPLERYEDKNYRMKIVEL